MHVEKKNIEWECMGRSGGKWECKRNIMTERVCNSCRLSSGSSRHRVLAIYVLAREPSSRVEFPGFPYVGSKCGSSPVQELPLLSQQHKNTGFKNPLFPQTDQQRDYHTSCQKVRVSFDLPTATDKQNNATKRSSHRMFLKENLSRSPTNNLSKLAPVSLVLRRISAA